MINPSAPFGHVTFPNFRKVSRKATSIREQQVLFCIQVSKIDHFLIRRQKQWFKRLTVEMIMNAYSRNFRHGQSAGKDARSLIVNDILSGGRYVSTVFYPGNFRAFELQTVVIALLNLRKATWPDGSLKMVKRATRKFNYKRQFFLRCYSGTSI